MSLLAVLGGGESGVGAALLGIKKGYEVLVSDKGEIGQAQREVLSNNEIEWESGGHSVERLLNAELVVKSPGIPDEVEVVQRLLKAGVPVISEVEFASRFTDSRIVAITGSNGKTTTATLTHALLKSGGLDVTLAGNIGILTNPMLNGETIRLDGALRMPP